MSTERNYAAEAVAILAGQSSLLPELAHLQALAAQTESVLKEHRLLSELLAAAMVDTGQQALFFPAADLERVRRLGINVAVTQNPTNSFGAVLVDLKRRALPPGADAARARVN
jgi:hypothetical protein